MNQRIQELIEQATTEVWGNNEYNGAPEFEGTKLDAEKLAELIVKECVNISEEVAIKHWPKENTYDAGKKAGAFECAKEIKKHFGIE